MRGLGGHQRFRQIQHVQKTLVVDNRAAVLVHLRDALGHAVQRHPQRLLLARKFGGRRLQLQVLLHQRLGRLLQLGHIGREPMPQGGSIRLALGHGFHPHPANAARWQNRPIKLTPGLEVLG